MEMSDFMWGLATGAIGMGGFVATGALGKAMIKNYLNIKSKAPKDKDLVSIIDLRGFVGQSAESTPIGSRSQQVINLARIKTQVEKAVDNGAKGLIIRINTGGGCMTTSDLVREYLYNINGYIHAYKTDKLSANATKGAKKPERIHTLAYIDHIAASAGYHIASAADKICIAPKAMTGSIGVFLYLPNLCEFGKKHGIEPVLIKRGKYKGTGMPLTDLSEETKNHLEEQIEETYRAFIHDVSLGRDMNIEQVEEHAHGGTLSAKQAKAAGLVDEIGYLKDALAMFKSKELGGLQNPCARNAIFNPFSLDTGVIGLDSYKIGEGIGNSLSKELGLQGNIPII